jgi:6,7-dimethyl-8-ribityllumazine synthase
MAIPNYRAFSFDEFPIVDFDKICIGIVRTEWNSQIVDSLNASCEQYLLAQGLQTANLVSVTVPGSFELPMGAKMMINSINKPDAVICLGCVIQGETKHDDYINHTIARALTQLGLVSNVPVIFGVLTVNNIAQAEARTGGEHGNKGEECAIAALKMISNKQKLSGSHRRIGFDK